MNHWKLVAGFCLLGFAMCSQAENYSPQCPASINTVEKINNPPQGWEPMVSSADNYLAGVSFYSGHPEEQASLKPESINKKQAMWTFSQDEAIYILCHYNQSGIDLSQALPANTTKCTVLFNTNVQGERGFIPQKIECIR